MAMIQNGGIITVNEDDALYLAQYLLASRKGDNPARPWQTTICPECGEIPTQNRMGGLNGDMPYTHILDADGFVLIGCEGYWVINPNVINTYSPNWHDWHEETGS
jgi:hypothetical protein